MKNLICIASAIILGLGISQAEVKLPSVIADNMVLQQKSDVKLWGKATPGKDVSITTSWDGKKTVVRTAADSVWMVTVSTPEAGGPYSIDIKEGKDGKTLENVLIGEVWFCSGQSNMEMPLRGYDRQPIQGANDAIAGAKKSTPIRIFRSDWNGKDRAPNWSKTPQDDLWGKWCENVPEDVAETSATAYFFAQYLQDKLEVPVGIIVSSLSGSRIECWISQEMLSKEFPSIDLTFLGEDGPIGNQHADPCVLFNGKINPLVNYGVKGFVWYQGESNRDNASQYASLMSAMVKDWRGRFDQGEELPFYFVQIAPYNYEGADSLSGAYLREAQLDAAKIIPNSGIVSTLDIGSPNFIHPVDKASVGKRLAWYALGDTYGRKGFDYQYPEYESHEVKDGKVYINVTVAPYNLVPMWRNLEGFEVAGEDGVFYPAQASVNGRSCSLVVFSPEVPEPKNVRYAFRNYPKSTVSTCLGLPLMPFRTDRD